MAEEKTKQASENSPPSSPGQKNIAPGTPPQPPRKKLNNGFKMQVSEKLVSPPLPPRIFPRAKKESLPKQDQRDNSGDSQTLSKAHGPIFSPPIFPHGNVVEKQIRVEEKFDLLSLENKAEEELNKRPKTGESYKAVDVESIEERLKYLSVMNGFKTTETIIDEALEIADSVSLLKINGTKSSKAIEMAGQKARKAATLMIQSQMMSKQAMELVSESKDIIQAADF